MALYLGGIMLMGALIFWWYGHKETRRIHQEEKIALKLHDLQCKRLLKNAPEGFECPIKKPDFTEAYDTLYRELAFAALLLFLFGLGLSYYLARISLRPMREAVDLVENFARSMIHDLNTPITTAHLNATALQKLDLNDAQRKRVKRILQSLQMLESLEERLKNAIAHAKIDYKEERIYLCELCGQLRERSPLLQLRCQNEIIIRADSVMIARMLDNLLSNAIKYNLNNHPIQITLAENRLTIQDRGQGIAHPERIFEPYYREKSSMPGLGLGLGIVKEVCEHYGIALDIESKSGSGTTVTLDFSTIKV